MGTLQVNKITQQSLLYDLEKKSLKQADKMFNYNHFRMGGKVSKSKIKGINLLIETLRNDNCEVQEFFDKKLRGALDDDNIEIVDLKTVQTKYRDITNNYYTTNEPFSWTQNEW